MIDVGQEETPQSEDIGAYISIAIQDPALPLYLSSTSFWLACALAIAAPVSFDPRPNAQYPGPRSHEPRNMSSLSPPPLWS